MTKAGEKLIAAAKEALASTRCRHVWQRISFRVEERRIVSQVDVCAKCGTRRTMMDPQQTSTEPVKAGDTT